jgi:DnaJ-class molecular chaperone
MRIDIEKLATALRARGWRVTTTPHVAYCDHRDGQMMLDGSGAGHVMTASGPIALIIEVLERAQSLTESGPEDCPRCGGRGRTGDDVCPACRGAVRS